MTKIYANQFPLWNPISFELMKYILMKTVAIDLMTSIIVIKMKQKDSV